jgi:sugar/nucleoside kinase (ribokinase family)
VSAAVSPRPPIAAAAAAVAPGPMLGRPGREAGAADQADPWAGEPRPAPGEGPIPTVVVVGSAARDIDEADPRGWRLGGSVTYGALTLARLGLRVGVVIGVDAAAAGARELDLLREAGAELQLVPLPSGPVYQLHDFPDHRELRCEEPGSPLPVASLPSSWRAAPAWYMGPVADELPDGWAAIPPGAIVAVGWQGLLRDLQPGAEVHHRPASPRALLRRADIVSVSVQDVDPSTDLRSLLRFLRPGAICTLTRGEHGGLAIAVRPGAPRMCRYRAVHVPAAPDPTGAGDAFLAGLLAARIVPALAGRNPQLSTALRFAAAVAAAHVAASTGLDGVPTLEVVRALIGESAAG